MQGANRRKRTLGREGRAALLFSVGLLLGAAACGEEPTPFRQPDVIDETPISVWMPEPTPTQVPLLGVWGRTSTDAYAVGWDGTVLRYDGLTWVSEPSITDQPLTDVTGSERRVFAVGWQGTLIERTPLGTWVQAASPTDRDLFAVHVSDDDLGLAVGELGTVLRYDGTVWTEVDLMIQSDLSGEMIRPRSTLSGVYSADGRRWVLAGAGGASFQSDDGGLTFSSLSTEESLPRGSVPLRGVWGPNRGTTYVVGLEGAILRLTNRYRRDGEGLSTRFLFGVWGQNDSDVTVVGQLGTVLRRLDGQWFEEPSNSDIDLRDVWVDGSTGLSFAVGAAGTVLVRTPPEDLMMPE